MTLIIYIYICLIAHTYHKVPFDLNQIVYKQSEVGTSNVFYV